MNAPAPMLPVVTIVRPQPMTPAEELDDFERTTGHVLTERQRARFLEAQVYKGGKLEDLDQAGLISMVPEGERVMMRAILVEDASLMSLGGELGGHGIEYDSRKSIAAAIISVGDGVRAFLDKRGVPDDTREKRSVWRKLRAWISGRGARHGARPMPGDHVFVLSTVADRLSKMDKTTRWWTVHVEDLTTRWKAP